MTEKDISELSPKERFEQEQAEISFVELQKFFARGVMITVDGSLDLVDVALQLHADNTAQIQDWLDQAVLVRAYDEHAKKWVEQDTRFLAVTVAPWVLVQELK